MRKLYVFLLLVVILINAVLICSLNIAPAEAQSAKEKFHKNLDTTAETMGYKEGVPGSAELTLSKKIGNIIGVMLSFLGVIFLILMIYGGFTWMLSRGNEQQVTKSKGIMFNALIGLIIVLAAYAIASYLGRNIAPQ